VKAVAEILKAKPIKDVVTISPDAPVYDAIKLMADYGIGALVVMEDERVVGMVTERDYARKVVLMNRSSSTTMVREIMSEDVLYVRPTDSNESCMAIMTENRLRHLPVIENDKLVGIISIGDLVKDIISEQQFIIHQLERYIAGGG